MQTCRERALDIAKNTLDEGEVRFTWVMHEQTHLLDRIRQVRPCEGQILQRTSEAAVLRGVGDGWTIFGGQFGLGVHGRRGGMALRHACTLEKLNSILTLREEQAISRARDGDAEKVVKCAEVRHRKL
jgi:hypothetical protein